jgi:hypothetical protein
MLDIVILQVGWGIFIPVLYFVVFIHGGRITPASFTSQKVIRQMYAIGLLEFLNLMIKTVNILPRGLISMCCSPL